MAFRKNSSVITCPLERVEFVSQSVNFETGSANSPLETCLNYGCNFADSSNYLSTDFCKCPEYLTPYEANGLERQYLYLNKYNPVKKNFWAFVALNKGKLKPEITTKLFACTLGKFSIYSESFSGDEFADCIYCKFASEDKVNKIIGNPFGEYIVKDITEVCNCPPDMTEEFYDEIYHLYKKQEPAQFLDLEKNFNRKEFQEFVASDYIQLKQKLNNLKVEEEFFFQDRQSFSRYYLSLMKPGDRQSNDEFKNIVLNWIDKKKERRRSKRKSVSSCCA